MKRILKTAPPPTDFILQTQLPDLDYFLFETERELLLWLAE